MIKVLNNYISGLQLILTHEFAWFTDLLDNN